MKNPTTLWSRRQFVHAAGLGLAASLVALPAGRGFSQTPAGVPPGRLARLRRGANVCRWFRFIPEDPVELAGYISDAEAQRMREMGLTHVRLCLQPKTVMDQATGAVREQNARFVEQAIDRFHRAGLLVVVDLHNEDRPAEVSPDWQAAFVRFWADFAARLARFDPELTIFEIVNEPVFSGHEADWNPLNARLAAAIREHAPAHTLITSGPNWGGIDGLKKLKLLDDPNVVYSFHCYDPMPFTHQGATWAGQGFVPLRGVPYPASPEAVAPLLPALATFPDAKGMLENYGRERWDKARLAARFKEGIAWGAQHNVPLYCGEFGVYDKYAPVADRARWFRDFGEVLAENRIGWSVWGWDEGFGLNRQYVAGRLVVDTDVAAALGLTAG